MCFNLFLLLLSGHKTLNYTIHRFSNLFKYSISFLQSEFTFFLKYKVQILWFPLLPVGEGRFSERGGNVSFSLASLKDSERENIRFQLNTGVFALWQLRLHISNLGHAHTTTDFLKLLLYPFISKRRSQLSSLGNRLQSWPRLVFSFLVLVRCLVLNCLWTQAQAFWHVYRLHSHCRPAPIDFCMWPIVQVLCLLKPFFRFVISWTTENLRQLMKLTTWDRYSSLFLLSVAPVPEVQCCAGENRKSQDQMQTLDQTVTSDNKSTCSDCTTSESIHTR